jgi:hypothetical protein
LNVEIKRTAQKKNVSESKYGIIAVDFVLLKGVANNGKSISNPPIKLNKDNIFSLYALMTEQLSDASCEYVFF